MVKCFSKCRKKPRSECFPNKCLYLNGAKRSYCRLSYNYKMNADCKPEIRILKGNQTKRNQTKRNKRTTLASANSETNNASEIKKINEINDRDKKTQLFLKRLKTNNATRKIQKFMKKYENKRKSLFLQSICSDSGVCIAFGKEDVKIKRFFDNFNNFALLSRPPKQIGAVSANGFVNELTFEKEGYVSNAILKSSKDSSSDNLFYEGLVGNFINKAAKIYPCFVETYGMYYYKTDDDYNNMKFKAANKLFVENGLTKITNVDTSAFEKACTESKNMAVLIQHIKGAKTLEEMLSNRLFVENDLLYVLFQVYLPLLFLRDVFTHYDLHTGNVLLYEPVNGSYIEYHYVLTNELTFSFKSKYIAKIIDYGRSYFMDDSNSNSNSNLGDIGSSKAIYDKLCKIPQCGNCGKSVGFEWLSDKPAGRNYFIASTYRNMSHDLRLANEVIKNTFVKRYNPTLYSTLKTIKYGEGITGANNKHYGTKENTSEARDAINNVSDIGDELADILMTESTKEANEKAYKSLTKLGDLYIYPTSKTQMKFVSAQI